MSFLGVPRVPCVPALKDRHKKSRIIRPLVHAFGVWVLLAPPPSIYPDNQPMLAAFRAA